MQETIAVDIGGSLVKLGVVTDGDRVRHFRSCKSVRDPVGLSHLIAKMVRDLRQSCPINRVAVSCAGEIDAHGNVTANQLGWDSTPLGHLLGEALGHHVPIYNDGHCALVAESKYGALKGISCGLMLVLGTGIGGGIVIDGVPYRGIRDRTPEPGHIITHAEGRRCSCGQRGCWEAYASGDMLRRRSGGLPPGEVIALAKRGEMHDLWTEYRNEMAAGILSLISLLCPEAVVLGGGLVDADDIVVEGIRTTVQEQPAWQQYYSFVKITKASLGNAAGMVGAANLMEEQP